MGHLIDGARWGERAVGCVAAEHCHVAGLSAGGGEPVRVGARPARGAPSEYLNLSHPRRVHPQDGIGGAHSRTTQGPSGGFQGDRCRENAASWLCCRTAH